MRTQRSFICKHVNENDIANLSQPTIYNKPHAKKQTIQKPARRPKYSQNSINKDRRIDSCMSRLAICHASKSRVCIQNICGDVLVNKTCNFCYSIPTNHYCRYPQPGSNVVIENEALEIYKLAPCFECKENWCAAEDFSNRCKKHKN